MSLHSSCIYKLVYLYYTIVLKNRDVFRLIVPCFTVKRCLQLVHVYYVVLSYNKS